MADHSAESVALPEGFASMDEAEREDAARCYWGPGCMCHDELVRGRPWQMPEPQTARYAAIQHGDKWLVVDLPKKGIHHGYVMAECIAKGPATKLVAALEARFPSAHSDGAES